MSQPSAPTNRPLALSAGRAPAGSSIRRRFLAGIAAILGTDTRAESDIDNNHYRIGPRKFLKAPFGTLGKNRRCGWHVRRCKRG